MSRFAVWRISLRQTRFSFQEQKHRFVVKAKDKFLAGYWITVQRTLHPTKMLFKKSGAPFHILGIFVWLLQQGHILRKALMMLQS